MKQIPVKLRTLSPVVLSAMSNATVMTATHTYFSGSILRGILAKAYIEAKGLGENAQEDPVFLQFFFDQLRFTAALPVFRGKRAVFAPLSLQKNKTGNKLLDLLHDKGQAGFKGLKGFVTAAGDTLQPVSVRKTISLHMSRSDQRNRDGKERLAGRSLSGGIYNYEAIDAGQEFAAFIYGEEKELQELRETIEGILQRKKWQCRVGRSKYTQYGLCQLKLGAVEPVPVEEMKVTDGTVCLRLDSPLLLPENVLSARQGLQCVVEALNQKTDGDFSLVLEPQKIFSKAESVENFVGAWGMKCPRMQALAAGTVFLLRKDNGWTQGDKTALRQLLYEGVGSRRAEGFGQIRVWPERKWQLPEKEKGSCISAEGTVQLGADVRGRAQDILVQSFASQLQVKAAQDAREAGRTFPRNSTHFFARLEELLERNRAGIDFKNALLQELEGNEKPFEKKLQSIRFKGCTLKRYLLEAGTEDMPNVQPYQETLDENAKNELDGVIDQLQLDKGKLAEEMFYTYWHWFFRYGRKAAAGMGKEGEAR